eukprot:TRINITY_DN67142_c2_g1_i1.p1 TRINITY_DN67142_c2_g1~~TRINITY_DN67142_c2_g1_i1.p1  ORF type:complete len:1352 (-),score=700.20 TRINITY_DN67142_c2_g1_i1:69-4124(-)
MSSSAAAPQGHAPSKYLVLDDEEDNKNSNKKSKKNENDGGDVELANKHKSGIDAIPGAVNGNGDDSSPRSSPDVHGRIVRQRSAASPHSSSPSGTSPRSVSNSSVNRVTPARGNRPSSPVGNRPAPWRKPVLSLRPSRLHMISANSPKNSEASDQQHAHQQQQQQLERHFSQEESDSADDVAVPRLSQSSSVTSQPAAPARRRKLSIVDGVERKQTDAEMLATQAALRKLHASTSVEPEDLTPKHQPRTNAASSSSPGANRHRHHHKAARDGNDDTGTTQTQSSSSSTQQQGNNKRKNTKRGKRDDSDRRVKKKDKKHMTEDDEEHESSVWTSLVGEQGAYIHPQSRAGRAVVYFRAALALYSVVLVPLEALFREQVIGESMIAFDYIVDVLFICAIALQFRTVMIDHHGNMTRDLRAIRQNYMSTTGFVTDVLSCVPFEIIAFAGGWGMGAELVGFLRFNRLLRVPHLRTGSVQEMKVSLGLLATKLLVLMFVVAHWFACIFVAAAKFNTGSNDTWMEHFGYDDESSATQYVTALYWAFVSMLTIGYGDVTARTDIEKIVVICVIVIGTIFYAVIFGNITLLIATADAVNRRYRSKMDNMNEFIRLHEIPPHLSKRLREYQQELWNIQKGFDMEAMLHDLPTSIRDELDQFLHAPLIESVPIFQDCEPAFITAIVSRLHTTICLEGDYICRRGEVSREMYFLRRGELDVMIAKAKTAKAASEAEDEEDEEADDKADVIAADGKSPPNQDVPRSAALRGPVAVVKEEEEDDANGTDQSGKQSDDERKQVEQHDDNNKSDKHKHKHQQGPTHQQVSVTVRKEQSTSAQPDATAVTSTRTFLDKVRSLKKKGGANGRTRKHKKDKAKHGDDGGTFLRPTEAIGLDGMTETVINIMKQGAFFGEMGLLFGEPRSASVRARVHSEVAVLAKEDFDEVITLFPQQSEHIIAAAMRRKTRDVQRIQQSVMKVRRQIEANQRRMQRQQQRKARRRRAGRDTMNSSLSNDGRARMNAAVKRSGRETGDSSVFGGDDSRMTGGTVMSGMAPSSGVADESAAVGSPAATGSAGLGRQVQFSSMGVPPRLTSLSESSAVTASSSSTQHGDDDGKTATTTTATHGHKKLAGDHQASLLELEKRAIERAAEAMDHLRLQAMVDEKSASTSERELQEEQERLNALQKSQRRLQRSLELLTDFNSGGVADVDDSNPLVSVRSVSDMDLPRHIGGAGGQPSASMAARRRLRQLVPGRRRGSGRMSPRASTGLSFLDGGDAAADRVRSPALHIRRRRRRDSGASVASAVSETAAAATAAAAAATLYRGTADVVNLNERITQMQTNFESFQSTVLQQLQAIAAANNLSQ